ncbi:hypothetical protein HYPSUDRAFT_865465 [Hypholoma sublateritium FD-334 SS-4]|uniref:Uncharacterized protein n=1 Tax=Hypholoma sublateritium (strain FD-334 SS-4) TaxID=945553 RepID=A0A0D2PGD1_HYPSF|nr:hypothetical protein HYPSUDRAFT_865465 [Hypholoma sublateritium FD-334 SS-4]
MARIPGRPNCNSPSACQSVANEIVAPPPPRVIMQIYLLSCSASVTRCWFEVHDDQKFFLQNQISIPSELVLALQQFIEKCFQNKLRESTTFHRRQERYGRG